MLKQNKHPIRTAPVLPAATRLGPVRIAVTSADTALPVWRDVVGLSVLDETETEIHLGVGDKVLIVLELGALGPVVPNTTGLYHVAIHVPERSDLASFVMRSAKAGVRFSPTDHLVTEAVYIWDRDGNGIEMTYETPWRGTLAEPGSATYAITAGGDPHTGREAIDLDDLLSEIDEETGPGERLPEGTRVGHIHVHVNDLDDAMHFYRDVIGFGGLMLMKDRGMGDVGLNYMPHTIAFNIWAGPNATQAPAGAAGLRYFTILMPDTETRDAVRARLEDAGSIVAGMGEGFETRDPSGNLLRIEVEA